MKKLVVIFAIVSTPAAAQTQNYYGPTGQYLGQSVQNGNTRNFYGPTGGYEGQEIRQGGARNYYGPTGGYMGQSLNNDQGNE